MKRFNWLGLWFVIGLIAVIIVGFTTVSYCAVVTLENCQPRTWVGGVRWLDNKTDYEDVPEFEIKDAGSIFIQLPEGDYALTHFRPRKEFSINGKTVVIPAAILEFREVTVGILPTTFSFGCGE